MQKGKSRLGIVLAVCTAIVCAAVLYSLRFSYLSCSDSVSEFVYGRIYDFGFAYKRSLDFCLQRGRFGLIFPFVVALRYTILGTGSFFAAWAVQYIPIIFNVGLFSYILGKRAGAKCGLLYSLLFFALLQVNGWHSLITCYPLDFMYGLTLAVIGLVLFTRKGIKFKLLSAFLFYESMQTYEAFLMVSVVYLFLAITILRKEGKLSVKSISRSLDAHMVTGVLFIAMRVFVIVHPIVPLQAGVEDLSKLGYANDMIATLGAFSGGMFPLVDMAHPRVRTAMVRDGVEIKDIIVALAAGIGAFAFMKSVKEDKEAVSKVRILGLCGIIGALSYPLIHALTAVYQKWVTEGHQLGYVPTTICYFGWILFITCAVAYLPLSGKTQGKKSPYIAGAILFVTALTTFGINHALKAEKIGPTAIDYSYKTQQFFAAARDSYCSEHGYDYIMATDFEGVHGNYMFHEIMLENESKTPYDVAVAASPDEYYASLQSYTNPGVILYDEDSDVAIITDCDDIREGHVYTVDDIRIVSAHGGSFTVSYEEEGGRVTQDISLSPGEGASLNNSVYVDISTIDVIVR